MLLETLSHLLALDLGWFISLVINNLIWVMFFAAAGYFMHNKKAILGGTLLTLYIYATVDLGGVLGWTFRQGIFFVPVFFLIALIAAQAFFGKFEWFQKNKFVGSIIFYLALIAANMLVVGG